jgi:prolyl-tRNA synthetase
MKDSYSFDLDDEGLQRSYDLHREAYVRIFERLGMDYRIVSASAAPWAAARRRSSSRPRPTARTPSCSAPRATTPPTPRPSSCAPPSPRPRHPAPAAGAGHAGHPDDRHAGHGARRPRPPGRGERHAKNVVVLLRSPDGRSSRWSSACPATARSTSSASRPTSRPPRCCPSTPSTSTPQLVKGYIGPAGARGAALRRRPARRARQRLGDGANEQGKHAVDVVMGRDFEPAGVVPAAEVRDGDPCGRCGAPLEIGRASRSATSSSSAASTPTPSASTCSGPTASRSA